MEQARIALNLDLCCCGVGEIHNLSREVNSEEALRHLISNIGVSPYRQLPLRQPCAFMIFTGVQGGVYDRDYGGQFAAYLMRYKLGKVQSSPQRINSNSGNRLRLWVWTPDWEALQAWWDERGERQQKGELS